MKVKNSGMKIGRFYSLVNIALFLSLIYCANITGDFTRRSNVSIRRVKNITFSEKWENWQKVYTDLAGQNKGQALINDLRRYWDEVRADIYETEGAEEYLKFLEGKLTGGSVPDKVRALWEMRCVYFDLTEGPLSNLNDDEKVQIREKVLNNIISSTDNIQGDFELWYNAKEVLTELLEDAQNKERVQNPIEEIWKPVLVASLKGLGDINNAGKPWVIDCIAEAIIPVRIANNPQMYELLLGLIDPQSSAWSELGLDDLGAEEKGNIRKHLAKLVVGEMLTILKNEIKAGVVGEEKKMVIGGKELSSQEAYENLRGTLVDCFINEPNSEMASLLADEALTSLRDKGLAGILLSEFESVSVEKKEGIIGILALIDYENDSALIEEVKNKLIDIYKQGGEVGDAAFAALDTLVNGGVIDRTDVPGDTSAVSQRSESLVVEQIGKFGDNVKTKIIMLDGVKYLQMNINGQEVLYKKAVQEFEEMHSNPIDKYILETNGIKDEFGRELPQQLLVKSGSNLMALNEYIGAEFYAAMGVPVPRMAIVRDGDDVKIAFEFLKGYNVGGLFLPERYHNAATIQKGIFVSALVGDGDSAPWNMMFKDNSSIEGSDFYRIDAGGFITRATGRLVAFGSQFSMKDFNRVTATIRHNQNLPVNEAYQTAKENFGLLYQYAQEFASDISEKKIRAVIDEAFDRVNQAFGEKKIVSEIEHWKTLLQAELPYWYRKSAWDHVAAITTLEKIENMPGGLQQYYVESLIARRNTIERLFGQKDLEPEFLSLISGDETTRYRITSIEQEDNVVKFGFEVLEGNAKINVGELLYNIDTGKVEITPHRISLYKLLLQGVNVEAITMVA